MPKQGKKLAAETFAELLTEFASKPNVSQGKMFGATGLKFGTKVFAMLVKGDLVVKLPADEVRKLVKGKKGKNFDPGHGKPMKEWIGVSATDIGSWSDLVKQALEYAKKLA